MQRKEGFLLCSAPEKALSKWDMVYEIVAVIFSAAVVLIDFPPNTYTHATHFFKSLAKEEFIAQALL